MSYEPLLLSEEQEWFGEWWLPDNPEDKLAGTLKYDGGGNLVLELYYSFGSTSAGPKETRIEFRPEHWPIIYGEVCNHEITLIETFSKGLSEPKPPMRRVMANFAIVGAHINGCYDEVFNVAEFSFEGLRQWGGVAAFGTTLAGGEYKCAGEVRNDDGVCYNLLCTSFNFTDSSSSVKASESELEVFLRVTSKKLFTLDDVLIQVDMLHSLVAFATTSCAGVTWLRLGISEVGTSSSEESKQAYLLYHPVAFGCRNAGKINASRMLFTCDSFSFETAVRNWLDIYTENPGVISIILSMIYDPDRYVEDKVLLAAVAGEALHKTLRQTEDFNCLEESIEYREWQNKKKYIVKILKEGGVEDCEQWLLKRPRSKKVIKRVTFVERLSNLAKRLDSEVCSELVEDVESWASKLKTMRNSFVHDAKFSEQISTSDAIANVTIMVVIFNLLKELGVPAEQQLKVIGQHPEVKKA